MQQFIERLEDSADPVPPMLNWLEDLCALIVDVEAVTSRGPLAIGIFTISEGTGDVAKGQRGHARVPCERAEKSSCVLRSASTVCPSDTQSSG